MVDMHGLSYQQWGLLIASEMITDKRCVILRFGSACGVEVPNDVFCNV
jgi:hypothetical protein